MKLNNHSPSRTEVNNAWNYSCTPPTPLWAAHGQLCTFLLPDQLTWTLLTKFGSRVDTISYWEGPGYYLGQRPAIWFPFERSHFPLTDTKTVSKIRPHCTLWATNNLAKWTRQKTGLTEVYDKQCTYSTTEMQYACVSGTRGDPCRPEVPWKWDR